MRKKLKIMSIFGTRPEAIKMSVLIKKMEADPDIESVVCVTAQHREMLDQVLRQFGIVPDYDLNLMEQEQSLSDITSRVLAGVDPVLSKETPDMVLVHGDTTTSVAAALAAFYRKIPVGHVEAGLRSYNKYSPFPEELNRQITSRIAALHFAPTKRNQENLNRENIIQNIFVTGNTVIDVIHETVSPQYIFKNPVLKKIDFNDCVKYILVTAHRRENLGKPLENICAAVREIAQKYNDVRMIWPVHMNPLVRKTAFDSLGQTDRVILTEPLDADDMHNLIARCFFVMTDSGGLQEEAPSLRKPVLVLRTETERPEAVEAGTVKMVGIEKENIVNGTSELIENVNTYDRMAKAVNPYGDGKACERIIQAIKSYANDYFC